MSTTIYAPNEANLARAVALLRAGGIVALPTETVYGLAADASNTDAIADIFSTKGRPANHPLIVHVLDGEAAKAWAKDWPDVAQRLADAFWPGPMTLIVNRASHVLDAVTGGQDTVGIRVPSHLVARQVLHEFANAKAKAKAKAKAQQTPSGLAAPSANKFGHVSPTTAQHVANEFAEDDVFILDGGACEVGVESTIIDVSGKNLCVLRPGRIRVAEIERVIGKSVAPMSQDSATPRVSGSLDSHYAPTKKTIMLDSDALEIFLEAARDLGKHVGLIAHSKRFASARVSARVTFASHDPARYEHDIYAQLREFDTTNKIDLIVIETPPHASDWDAVNDRLRRATFGK